MTNTATNFPETTQPLHFHAPHKTPAHERLQRPDAAQRVWTVDEIHALLALPFNDLMFQAQSTYFLRASCPSTVAGTRIADMSIIGI